jgi:hypothetical protein
MKECNKCKDLKELIGFYKDKNKIDGYSNYCKLCQKQSNKSRYGLKKDEIKLKTNKYYHQNKIDLKPKYLKNTKKFKINNPNYDKLYYQNNKENIDLNYKIWIKNNKNKINEYNRVYQKEWNRKNKHINLWINILCRYLKSNKYIKCENTLNELKYGYSEFKDNINNKFEKWMNWENHGIWELHHNIPLSWFKSNTPPHLANSLNNLFPLEKKENRQIKNKYIKFKITKEYSNSIIDYIKDEYKRHFNIY